MRSININMRKLETSDRRRFLGPQDYSPMVEAYKMLREVDPKFEQLMSVQEKYYIKKK